MGFFFDDFEVLTRAEDKDCNHTSQNKSVKFHTFQKKKNISFPTKFFTPRVSKVRFTAAQRIGISYLSKARSEATFNTEKIIGNTGIKSGKITPTTLRNLRIYTLLNSPSISRSV